MTEEIIISSSSNTNNKQIQLVPEPKIKINIPDLDSFNLEQLVLLHEGLEWLIKDVKQRISLKKETEL
jgi:hypothetical protein